MIFLDKILKDKLVKLKTGKLKKTKQNCKLSKRLENAHI